MGKIETARLASRKPPGGNGSANGNGANSAGVGGMDPDAILDLLAAGDPPAFATDSRDRIIFWNRGMTELLGRRSDETLGLRCYDTLAGRDVFGNRFCYANCPVMATLREGDPVRGFELKLSASAAELRAVSVTVLKIPGVRPDLFTLVHILQPTAAEGRFARMMEQLAASGGRTRSSAAVTGENGQPLTRRETEILHHVAAGLQNKEVAHKLDISLATVRNHVHNMLDKLGVHSKLEAVSLSFRNGWVATQGGPIGPQNSRRPSLIAEED